MSAAAHQVAEVLAAILARPAADPKRKTPYAGKWVSVTVRPEVLDKARAALAEFEAKKAQPAVELTDEFNALLLRFERQAQRFGELWERCQGKGWPEAESTEFNAIRDDRLPDLKKQLRAIAAGQADEKPAAGVAFGVVDRGNGGASLEFIERDGVRMHLTADEHAELERLRALINTPELICFRDGVVLEAAHQRERWGSEYDAGKAPADWFWLVGYLAGKALHAQAGGNTEKALHHTISTAAALANWHAAISGEHNAMRPGIDPAAHGIPAAVEHA